MTAYGTQQQENAQASIDLVNQARHRLGLTTLSVDATLGQVAQAYSRAMARGGFYGHTDLQGHDVGDRLIAVGYGARMSAENIARGQSSPSQVVEGWLDSPGHRANILNPQLTHIGAGYAYTPTPAYHHYWTHVFATPDPSTSRDRSRYVAEAQQLLDAARRAAGQPTLRHAPDLDRIAQEHLTALQGRGSTYVRSQARSVLGGAGNAALQSYRRATAQLAAGRATPEEAVDEWERAGTLLDPAWQAAGLAYGYAGVQSGDDLHHYWLLLLAG